LLAKNKKAHSSRVGQNSLSSLKLDDGPSLPVGPVRKSPPIGICRELHEKECTDFPPNRQAEFVLPY
jgi:hypothetical protein